MRRIVPNISCEYQPIFVCCFMKTKICLRLQVAALIQQAVLASEFMIISTSPHSPTVILSFFFLHFKYIDKRQLSRIRNNRQVEIVLS